MCPFVDRNFDLAPQVGFKSDVDEADRKVTFEEAEELAAKIGDSVAYRECSAKEYDAAVISITRCACVCTHPLPHHSQSHMDPPPLFACPTPPPTLLSRDINMSGVFDAAMACSVWAAVSADAKPSKKMCRVM